MGLVMLRGHVVHVDMHGEVIMAGCNLIATKHVRCGLSCMQKLWKCISIGESVWDVGVSVML